MNWTKQANCICCVMLMVADLPGVGWRILDGAGWRRHHPCLSIGFFHHHTVYAQMHQKRRG